MPVRFHQKSRAATLVHYFASEAVVVEVVIGIDVVDVVEVITAKTNRPAL